MHQSQGNRDDTQVLHELGMLGIRQENQTLNVLPESVAVKECEVGSSKVGALVDPDGQPACEVGLAFWDSWE